MFVAAVLVAGCAGVTEEDRQAAAAATKLSGADITATIVENTMTGRTTKNESWTEYYEADGTIKGIFNGESYDGAWRIDGDRMCYDYEDNSYDGCASLAVSGDKVYSFKEDGSLSGKPATLIAGNPNGL